MRSSRSRTIAALHWEATIAGGLFGFLTGVLFLVATFILGGPATDARLFSLIFGSGLMVCGAGACALMARWIAIRATWQIKLDDITSDEG